MGTRVLYDPELELAVLYDSVTNTPLPLMIAPLEDEQAIYEDAQELAEHFLEHLPDPRQLSEEELQDEYKTWRSRQLTAYSD